MHPGVWLDSSRLVVFGATLLRDTGCMEQVVHRSTSASHGIKHLDCLLEIFDAGAKRAFGATDVVGLEIKRYAVAVAVVIFVDGKTDGRNRAIAQV